MNRRIMLHFVAVAPRLLRFGIIMTRAFGTHEKTSAFKWRLRIEEQTDK